MSPEPETQPESAVEQVEAAVEAVPATISQDAQLALAEVEVFWANVFANVSPKVETLVHNYLESEVQALKARIVARF